MCQWNCNQKHIKWKDMNDKNKKKMYVSWKTQNISFYGWQNELKIKPTIIKCNMGLYISLTFNYFDCEFATKWSWFWDISINENEKRKKEKEFKFLHVVTLIYLIQHLTLINLLFISDTYQRQISEKKKIKDTWKNLWEWTIFKFMFLMLTNKKTTDDKLLSDDAAD